MVISGLNRREAEVVAHLHAAIMEQRLLPGTRLTEEELGDIFQVSRMRIRRVLLALAHTGMIELPPGRGAIVARPSPDQARHIFSARRLVEGQLLEAPLTVPPKRALRVLHDLCAQEDEAAKAQDRTLMIQLSGTFHIMLAKAYGNEVLADIVSGLVSRSALILAFYQGQPIACCRPNDHRLLLKELEKKAFPEAGERMRAHLLLIEASLALDHLADDRQNLRNILLPRSNHDIISK